MRSRNIIISVLLAVACAAYAADQLLIVKTTATNAATSVNGTFEGFAGTINEITIQTASGVTGDVKVVMAYPYSGQSVVLASNTVTGFMVFRPRVGIVSISGDAALSVTNTIDGEEFMVSGESIVATVVNGTATSTPVKVRVKYSK